MKIALTLCFTALLFFGNSQKRYGFLEAHAGTRLGGLTSGLSVLRPGIHLDGGVGYMMTRLWGIKGVMAFDTYKCVMDNGTSKDIDRSYMIRGSVEGIFSISALANFATDKIALYFHSGYGFATSVNPSVRKDEENAGITWNDPTVKGNDDMVSIIIGFTPQYKINNQFSINADFSTVLLPKQSRFADRAFDDSPIQTMGTIFNASIGVTYRLVPKSAPSSL